MDQIPPPTKEDFEIPLAESFQNLLRYAAGDTRIECGREEIYKAIHGKKDD